MTTNDTQNQTTRHLGACESCDQIETCVAQDECWQDHRSLLRMAQLLTEQKASNDGQ